MLNAIGMRKADLRQPERGNMRQVKLIAAMGFGIVLTACGMTTETPSRNAPFDPETAGFLPGAMSVAQVDVTVPYDLKISESNTYYPVTDIVWRGDPSGDRRAQSRQIFETAFTYGTRDMEGERQSILEVEVKRFHSLTDRVRLSVGGVHHMVFDLTVRDALTGAVILPTREIDTSLTAFGGLQAVRAQARGQTQKVRVTGYLARVIQQELGLPVTI